MVFIIKRYLDWVISLVLLIMLFPLFIVISILIKIDSQGPVLFTQRRAGLHGKPFLIYKFRSMIVNAENMGSNDHVEENDERITKFGFIIRQTSMDELPQLINILKGDMSLVGPRPIIIENLDQYNGRQRIRLQMKPGMTGLAQVNGRELLTWPEKIEYDIKYVHNYTLLMDIIIILKTVLVLFQFKKVYKQTLEKINE